MADTTTPTSSQTVTYGFAPEISPYAQGLLGAAAGSVYQYGTDASGNVQYDQTGMPVISGFQPYQQYQGERVAQYSPLQQLSYENAATMQTAPQLQDATALAGEAGLGALNTSYTYNPVTNQYYSPSGYTTSQFTADQVGSPQFSQEAAQQYMSPYIQGVVNVQEQEAKRQAAISGQAQQAAAAKAGMFGGGRDIIGRSQAAADLQRQLGGIQATGLQNAYQQAQTQFNTDQARALQAGQLNQAANLQAQQLAEQSKQYGYNQAQQQAALSAQYGQAAAQLNAQQGQFGAGLGLQGLQAALSASQQLGNLGNTQYQENMGINQMQNQYGLQQQQQAQNILNTQYQDYLNYQNYPYKQLGFLSDILRGVPLTQTGTSLYTAAPTTIQNLASLGTAAAGLSKLMAEGGATSSKGSGLGAIALNSLA